MQACVLGQEDQSDGFSGLKFEIFCVVFRLHKGNLPVRINEKTGSLLPQRFT
jgi:hypothetical protein